MFAKLSKTQIFCVVIILLIVAQVVLCYMDCVKITTTYLGGMQIQHPEPEVSYTDLGARFVLLMAIIRICLLVVPKTGFQVAAGILSAFVATMTSAWIILLSLENVIGGLVGKARELTGIGHTAVVLSWIIVAAQAGVLIGTLVTTPKQADGSRKKYASWFWIMGTVLLILVLIVFRDSIYEAIKWLF